MKKRLLCALFAVLFVITLATLTTLAPLAASAASASAKATQLDVKWNPGYVGNATHKSHKNELAPGGAGYTYSDVIVIPKAGTRVFFTDNVGNAGVSHTAHVFSTWMKSGDDYVLDPDGMHMSGTANMPYIGQTFAGASIAEGMNYEFITDKDNQPIRICYLGDPADGIKVYAEPAEGKSTRELFDAENFTAVFNADGSVTGLKWFCGYASSATNTNGSARETKYASNAYAFSGFVKVPKARTKITYTFSESVNTAYNSVTRYNKVGSRYVYDIGFDATSNEIRSGDTVTYVTEKDGEVLRFCVHPSLNYDTIRVDPPVKEIRWEASNATPTASTRKVTEWPEAKLQSIVTGAPLVGKELTGLKWLRGFVGSQYQDNVPFTFTPNNVYMTSEVFTVPKAGTTVVVFDPRYTEWDGGMHASTSAMSLSHWKQTGKNVWIFDRSKEYYNGCDMYNIPITDEYRIYNYTTKEDNEHIRLCMRYAPMYSYETDVKIPPVYLVDAVSTDGIDENKGSLNNVSYKELSGDKVDFSVYFPESYDGKKVYPLVFDTTKDGKAAKYLSEKRYAGIVAWYNGKIDKTLRLLDALIATKRVAVSDILFVGGTEIAAHILKYDHIRLARALVQTEGETIKAPNPPRGKKFAEPALHAAVKNISDFGGDYAKAAEWLIDQTKSYYDILSGLKMYAIGDSYFGGSRLGQHQTWVNLIGHKYRMTFHNYGIGGNTIAFNPQMNKHSPAMCTRTKEIPKNGDIYIIEGGRNDRHFSVPFGKNTDRNKISIKGAINMMIDEFRKGNPDALIVLVTPWSRKSESGYIGTNNDYADAMKQLADFYNDPHIVCLYAADTKLSGIDMDNLICRQKYSQDPDDVSHLNADGMYMVLNKFDKWIAEKYAKLKNIPLTDSKSEPKFEEAKETTPVPETTPLPETTPAEPEKPDKRGCGSIATAILPSIMSVFAIAFAMKKKKH